MAEQSALFDIGSLNPHQFAPVQSAVEGASRYTHGAHSIEGLDQVHANRFRALGIARAYQIAEKQPESPHIRKSYGALAKETNRQHEFMTKPREQGGMGIQHEVVDHDPYKTPEDMAKDVQAGHIKTFSSAATGGHAALSNEEMDRFRAVHDVFGHAATGRGFDANGEEAAYLSHRQMFSKRALPALTSELRGQNSYLNSGPGGLNGPDAKFPDQAKKLIGLPRGASRK